MSVFRAHGAALLVSLNMLSCVTIKAAALQGVIYEPGVGVEGRSEDKHTRVEAVGPAGIRSGGQLVPLEQLVHVTQNLRENGRSEVKLLLN